MIKYVEDLELKVPQKTFVTGEMKNRVDSLIEEIVKASYDKFEETSHKGDWRDRKDKSLTYLLSGLIHEVAELQTSIIKKDHVNEIVRECGDVLNYLIIILDSVHTGKHIV